MHNTGTELGPRGMPPDTAQMLHSFDEGTKVMLEAMILRTEGEFTEVAFPAPGGETSHTVWLPSHTEVAG